MKRKKQSNGSERGSSGYEHLPVDSDFYAGSPSEKPLYGDTPVAASNRIRKTGRHKAAQGRRKEGIDPREKMALLAILKTSALILLLLIAFFMLKKGIRLYEESVWIESQADTEKASPVMQSVELIEEFNIENTESRALFSERIAAWKEADRLVRSADNLMKRDNINEAISRCQDALRVNPAHMGALERLGQLYLKQGMTVESINSYIRLISIDPSRIDHQESLISVLSEHGDTDSVVFLAQWYLEENFYDGDVQRYLANSLYSQNAFESAAEAYERVLQDTNNDVEALEKLAKCRMQLEDFEGALSVLERLRMNNYRDMDYYHQIAICNAQLGKSTETVQTLGKAAHLFGQKIVMGWIQDPRLDPVREDRTFQAFADRVGGEEFRKWLEQVARTMGGEERKDIAPQLNLPQNELKDKLILQGGQ